MAKLKACIPVYGSNKNNYSGVQNTGLVCLKVVQLFTGMDFKWGAVKTSPNLVLRPFQNLLVSNLMVYRGPII